MTRRVLARHNVVRWLFYAGLAFQFATGASAETSPIQIAPNVFALLGTGQQVAPANMGVVANVGWIVGPHGTLVIDTGSSRRFGDELRQVVASTAEVPSELVVITHQAPEFVFGASAFVDAGVPILAHAQTARLIAARCEICLKRLRDALGEVAMQGSRVVVPDRTVEVSQTIQVGGRDIDLRYDGQAATPGDLTVFDGTSGTLFAGGLVTVGRIPDVRADSDIAGWLGTLMRLESLPIRTIVPGFGPPLPVSGLELTAGYLRALQMQAQNLFTHHVSLANLRQHAALPEFANWSGYPAVHVQNLQNLYLQFEKIELQTKPVPSKRSVRDATAPSVAN